MKQIQVTLYDIFGYLFPGAVFLASIFLVYWTLFLPAAQSLDHLTTSGWCFVLAFAYLIGHMVQALANLLLRLRPATVDVVLGLNDKHVPSAVITAAKERAKQVAGLDNNADLTQRILYDICDHHVQQNGKTDTRDIYVYREGFYRGMAVAFLMLAIALLVRATRPGATLDVWGVTNHLLATRLISLSCLSMFASVLTFQRFRRFGTYRVKYAIYSFLVFRNVRNNERGCHVKAGLLGCSARRGRLRRDTRRKTVRH